LFDIDTVFVVRVDCAITPPRRRPHAVKHCFRGPRPSDYHELVGAINFFLAFLVQALCFCMCRNFRTEFTRHAACMHAHLYTRTPVHANRQLLSYAHVFCQHLRALRAPPSAHYKYMYPPFCTLQIHLTIFHQSICTPLRPPSCVAEYYARHQQVEHS